MVEDAKRKTEDAKAKIKASPTKSEVVYNVLQLKGKCTSRDIVNFIEAEYKQKIDIHDVTSALYNMENSKVEKVGMQGTYNLWQVIPPIELKQTLSPNVIQQFYVDAITTEVGNLISECDKQITELENKLLEVQTTKAEIIKNAMQSISNQILSEVSNKMFR